MPRIMVPGKYLRLLFPDALIERVEQYRRTQSPIPSRSAAIRALVEQSLNDTGIPKVVSPRVKKSK